MRILRTLVAAAITLAGVLAVSSSPAHADIPAPPYTGFTFDGPGEDFAGKAPDVKVSEVPGNGVEVSYTFQNWLYVVDVTPPTGQDFTLGTFPMQLDPDATHAGFRISTSACGGSEWHYGYITVKEISRDPGTHALTALAITYDMESTSCTTISGEIRYHSSVPYVGVTASGGFDFGESPVGYTTPALTETFTAGGPTPLVFGPLILAGPPFTVTSDTCSNTTLSDGQSCTITVTAHPASVGQQSATMTLYDNTPYLARCSIGLGVDGVPEAHGTYVPVNPLRLLDTRNGTGVGRAAPLGANSTLRLQVAGNGVPPSGVSAVVLNVTATQPSAASYLTVYPTGVSRPTASTLNFPPGWTGANAVTVPVGADGGVDFYNHTGTVHVIADVVGYYVAGAVSSLGTSGGYQFVQPTRLIDTRDPSYGQPLKSRYMLTLSVDFGASVNGHVRALAVNVTAVNPGASGFLTTWDGQNTPPGTSTLNFTPHAIVPNLAVIPTAPCTADPSCGAFPAIGIYNGSAGSVDVIVDIFGFYDDNMLSGGLRFHPITPTRITDTRIGLGAPHALGAGQTATVTTPGTIADPDTVALATNVTAVTPTTDTYISVWPAGVDRPTISNLNPTRGQIIPNAVLTGVDGSDQFSVFNHSGTVDVVVDVAGTFEAFTPPALRTQSPVKSTIVVTPQHAYQRRV